MAMYKYFIISATLVAVKAVAADVQPAPAKPSPWATRPEQAIPQGTDLRVRIDQPINTRHDRAGYVFHATLADPLVPNGETLLPRGTRFTGHVIESKPSGRLKGRAVLMLALDSFRLNGMEYHVSTASTTRVSGRHKKRNLALIGGGAATGASIGALAGGGVGALAGAAVGGVAGTASAVITGRKNVGVPAETLLTFPLRSSVRL
jgi:hypothetical protein